MFILSGYCPEMCLKFQLLASVDFVALSKLQKGRFIFGVLLHLQGSNHFYIHRVKVNLGLYRSITYCVLLKQVLRSRSNLNRFNLLSRIKAEFSESLLDSQFMNIVQFWGLHNPAKKAAELHAIDHTISKTLVP